MICFFKIQLIFKMKFYSLLIIFLLIFFAIDAQTIQWRGDKRDGHFSATGLLKQWTENGPELLLEVNKIGKGFSSPVFDGATIYVTGMIDTLDYLTAITSSGEIKWQVPYGRSWNQSFPDTRSTPVAEGSRIYVQSGTGRLSCIDAADGKIIWAVEVDKKFETEYHFWGNSETPLIIDDKVICTPGGKKTSVVAFNKLTGETVWQSKSLGGPRAYASATIYEYNNFRYILAVIGTHLLALKPESGEIAWSYQYYDPKLWDQPGLIWTNTPVFRNDEIFLSKGYDYPAKMLKMNPAGTAFSEKYTNTIFDNHHHGLILDGKYLYGSNWISNNKGNWVCMDWETGEIKYEAEWGSKGSIIMADGLFYCYNEKGNVGLVKPNPETFEVISEFKITKGNGPHWAHPFIADGKLFIRHGEVLLVYNIKS